MRMSLAYYRQQLHDKGIGQIIMGRLRAYKQSFQMNNWFIGKLIELTGNEVNLDGVRLNVDNPLVLTKYKSTLYFGIYEVAERELSKRYIDRSLPTVEIGASIGGVSCIVNKLLTDPSAHVVVECNPVVLPTLETNRELNGCKFVIEPRALAYGTESVEFSIATDHFMMGRLHGDTEKQISVPTITLRQIIEKYRFETINLISDSEGSEVEMVEHDANVLRDRVKWIILETHEAERGAATIARVLSTLSELGFEVECRDHEKSVLALINRRFTVPYRGKLD